jgi:hypothetical protein
LTNYFIKICFILILFKPANFSQNFNNVVKTFCQSSFEICLKWVVGGRMTKNRACWGTQAIGLIFLVRSELMRKVRMSNNFENLIKLYGLLNSEWLIKFQVCQTHSSYPQFIFPLASQVRWFLIRILLFG